jgi:RNA recognition motif-containing protein
LNDKHCKILTKGSYAFIEFEDERDAEDAMNELQDKNMGGLRINIGIKLNKPFKSTHYVLSANKN